MASPQIEDGHFFRIANEIAEALCKVNLSPYESRVLWSVFRKTYGYGKKTDRISLSQISAETGLNRGHAGRALRSLKKRNMILAESNRIGLQKDYDKWQGVPTKARGVPTKALCLQRPQNGASAGLKMVPLEALQKKERQKTYRVKDKPSPTDPRVKEFINWFASEYENRFGQPYHPLWGKHSKLVKSLLHTFDLTELKKRTVRLWECDDPFISRTDRGIGILSNQVNKLATITQPAQCEADHAPRGDLTYRHE